MQGLVTGWVLVVAFLVVAAGALGVAVWLIRAGRRDEDEERAGA